MNFQDIIVLAAVVCIIVLAVIGIIRKKGSGCAGCTGDCPGCRKGKCK